MANFKESAFLAYEVFRELANHGLNLATKLQGLVPSNKVATSMSVQYLYDDAVMFKELSEKVKVLMTEMVTSSLIQRSSGQVG